MGDKYPAEISGGMRKRVAIARALVTEPEIVFFDEPTTGLDPVLVNTIHHLILDLHRRFRFTAVVVSHEIPEIFEIADTVAMLHEGRIVEVGPPAAIQASPNPGRAPVHPGRARQARRNADGAITGEHRGGYLRHARHRGTWISVDPARPGLASSGAADTR